MGAVVVVLALAAGLVVPRWLAARDRAQVVRDLAAQNFDRCITRADTDLDRDRCYLMLERDLDRR